MDFQLVLRLRNEEIMYILNTLGLMVQSGRRFCDGDMVSGIFEDCDVRLMQYEETGRQVLRVIIPDKYNHFPEEPNCMPPYCLRLLETDDLYMGGQKL